MTSNSTIHFFDITSTLPGMATFRFEDTEMGNSFLLQVH